MAGVDSGGLRIEEGRQHNCKVALQFGLKGKHFVSSTTYLSASNIIKSYSLSVCLSVCEDVVLASRPRFYRYQVDFFS